MIRLCAFADEAASDKTGQIAALKRNGIALLEFRSVDGKNIADLTEKEAEKYAETFSENGIAVWSLGSPLGKSNISEERDVYFARAEKLCALARVTGAKNIRAFSFFGAYHKRDEVLYRLQKTVEIAAKYGVAICHENEKEIYGDTLYRVLDLLDHVEGLSFVYDPANFIQCGERAEDTIKALCSKAAYFHIKDAIEKSGELVPAGHGDGKIEEIVARIENDTVLTLEPHLALFDAYRAIDNTEMKHKFHFADAGTAFDAAVNALKTLLVRQGYGEIGNIFVK